MHSHSAGDGMIVDGHTYELTTVDDHCWELLDSTGLAVARLVIEFEQAMFEVIGQPDLAWSCHENDILSRDYALAEYYVGATA